MQVQNMTSFNPQGLIQGTQATSFTDDQQDKAKEIIAQYNVESMSQEDALSMRKELRSAGVSGQKMREMLKDMPKPEESALVPTSSAEVKEASDPKAMLMQLVEQKESGEIEEKDFSSQLAQMKMEVIGSVLNVQA